MPSLATMIISNPGFSSTLFSFDDNTKIWLNTIQRMINIRIDLETTVRCYCHSNPIG